MEQPRQRQGWQGLSWSSRSVVVMLIATSVAFIYSDRLMPHVHHLTDACTHHPLRILFV
jgi:hypothetical protein